MKTSNRQFDFRINNIFHKKETKSVLKSASSLSEHGRKSCNSDNKPGFLEQNMNKETNVECLR